MLEIKYIRQNLSAVNRMLEQRSAGVDLTAFEENDRRRRQLLVEIEELRHRRNVVSNRIAEMKKSGEPAEPLLADMRQVADAIKSLEKHLNECDAEVKQLLLGIPNMPHATVPVGKDAGDNAVISRDGALPQFDFEAKPHWDVGSRLGIFDFDRASHITGARFPLYLNKGAKLERALIQFMLDVHTEQNSYTEVLPPFIVNRQSMTNTGQLPKFEQDLFKIEGWDYFLIPTAEVPVTNIHQGEVLAEERLPIYYTAYSPCFRSEAGSYGKDTRGLIRQHQFNKVELVKFVQPETSYDELEKLLADAVSILTRLELPYQVVNLCTGDLGFSAAKTYDIEVWMPAQGVYREISSCSNFESFQARRANIRYKPAGQKGSRLVHTLNGSGLAVGRTVAAILENFQQADGSVVIPRQLRPYMGNISKLVP